MTDIELILTMLGEATTTKLHRDRDSKGMTPLKKDAKEGGAVAGRTRKDIETHMPIHFPWHDTGWDVSFSPEWAIFEGDET